MKLLILTQKIDQDDPVLGFFHRWVEEFAKHCESIFVVCLGSGKYDLPKNVRVVSLGKPSSGWPPNLRGKIIGRLLALLKFYKYIWQERKNYDTVFVHMNQEYVLLGGLFWRLFDRKIWLWRNHPIGSLFTRIAVWLADRVFCTSAQSFTASFNKTEIMPVGIDTDFFIPNPAIEKQTGLILFLGRISPIKNPKLFIESLLLVRNFQEWKVKIVGSPLDKDVAYYNSLQEMVKAYEMEEKIVFLPGVPNHLTPPLYNQAELFVNLTPSGSFDKTILEAMSCGTITFTANKMLEELLNSDFVCSGQDKIEISQKIEKILLLTQNQKEEIRRKLRLKVVENHSLKMLAQKLFI